MLPEYFEFRLPTKVVYGAGILKQLDALRLPEGKRAILVTDPILRKVGLADRVVEAFDASTLKITAIFDAVPPNSTTGAVEACAQLAREKGCDAVVACGGGSVMDTAKVANLLCVKGGRLEQHMGAYLLDLNESLLPMILIPTTAGTGSEVTKVAVIADLENDVKLPFAEEQFLPDLAILDPELTVSMPGKLTAATGMDALTHAIEAYVDKEWSPASDALALHAIRLISQSILQACAHPEDITARGAMLTGSFLAGVAFSHSMVGMVHGISHALGGVYHIPHGLANALVLPEVMQYNLSARLDRYADVARALGVRFPLPVEQSQSMVRDTGHWESLLQGVREAPIIKEWLDLNSHKARHLISHALDGLGCVDDWIRRQAALAGVERIRTLNRQLAFLTGMPLNLKDAGVKDEFERLDQVVKTAMQDGAMLYNPVDPTPGAVRNILKNLYLDPASPLPVEPADLSPGEATGKRAQMTDVFKDSDMLYEVLVSFYEKLKTHPDIGPALQKTGLCVQFVYEKPDGIITVDTRGGEVAIHAGAFDGTPEVTMTMEADFAHRFWHGKANLITALTRRQVRAKGNVPKTIKLLPILKPAFDLYPKHLRASGLNHLVIT